MGSGPGVARALTKHHCHTPALCSAFTVFSLNHPCLVVQSVGVVGKVCVDGRQGPEPVPMGGSPLRPLNTAQRSRPLCKRVN